MKQNADFQEGISEAESPAKPLLNPKLLTTNESFQMRYHIRIFPRAMNTARVKS